MPAALLALLLPVTASALNFNYDVAVVSDDNVNRAQEEFVREDTFVAASLGAVHVQTISTNSVLVYRAALNGEGYSEFDGLSNFGLLGALDYKFQFGRGFTVSRFTLTASLLEQDFRSDIRDGTTLSLQARMAKRFTDRIAGTLGLGATSRESESEVFDNDAARLFLNLDYNWSGRLVSYATLNFISGDVVSSSPPTLDIINGADAIEPDDAFGGLETGWFAYRLQGETTMLTLGLNFAVNNKSSLDFSVEGLNTQTDVTEYDRLALRVNYLGNF